SGGLHHHSWPPPDRRSGRPGPADTGFLRPADPPEHGRELPPARAAVWRRVRLPPWLQPPACAWLPQRRGGEPLPHACAPPRRPCVGLLPRRPSFWPLPRPVVWPPRHALPLQPSAFRPAQPAVVPRRPSVPGQRAPLRRPPRAVRPDV